MTTEYFTDVTVTVTGKFGTGKSIVLSIIREALEEHAAFGLCIRNSNRIVSSTVPTDVTLTGDILLDEVTDGASESYRLDPRL